MKIFYFTSKELNHDDASKIMNGDILMINDSNRLYVCINCSEPPQINTKYKSVNVVYSKEVQLDISVYNHVIFDNDGIGKRYGNVYAIKEIMNQIDNDSIHKFLQECIGIASYKEDRFSSNLLIELCHRSMSKLELSIHPTPYPIVKPDLNTTIVKEEEDTVLRENTEKKDKVKAIKSYEMNAHPTEFYFYDFLDETAQKEWVKLYNEKMSVRNIFYELKAKYKISFRQALKMFNNEHMDLNIYSLKPCSVKKSDSDRAIHQPNKWDFLYKELANRGFIQVSSEIWEDKSHTCYRISIEEL